MNATEAIQIILEDKGVGRQKLANALGYTQSASVTGLLNRSNMTTDMLCWVCDILGYDVVLKDRESEKNVVLTATERKIRRSGNQYTTGKARADYDEALFETLYTHVQAGEMTAKEAYTELGVNYRKWYRLCKAREEVTD